MILHGEAPLTFEPLSEKYFETLYEWHHEPHVKEWWTPPRSVEQVAEHFEKDLKKGSHFPHVILFGGIPMGLISLYHAASVGGGWWEDEPVGTWGTDQFIGEPNFLGRGLGTRMVRAFSDELLAQPGVERAIVDPAPTNTRAIACFEAAGYQAQGLVQTPDGELLLMKKERLHS